MNASPSPKPRPGARAACAPPLARRPQLDAGGADDLAALFDVLAHGPRLRLLHALVRAGELRLTDLAEEVEMSPQAASNQLRRLVDRGIVANRRDGASALYRIADPCVVDLLDRGLCLRDDATGRP